MIKIGPRNRGSRPLQAATHYKRPLRLLRLPANTIAPFDRFVKFFFEQCKRGLEETGRSERINYEL